MRLLQGDYERETTYDADPVDAAKRWAGEGAEFLHVVDLDGAKAGEPRNLEQVRRIAAAVECPIQVGGGLRDAASVAAVLDAGAERVVIGTAALRDPAFLDARLEAHGERVVVSVDARERQGVPGRLDRGQRRRRRRGRRRAGPARRRPLPLHRDRGRRHDGGPGSERAESHRGGDSGSSHRLGRSRGPLAISKPLPSSTAPNVEGAIVGRALYESRFTVAEGIAALA